MFELVYELTIHRFIPKIYVRQEKTKLLLLIVETYFYIFSRVVAGLLAGRE